MSKPQSSFEASRDKRIANEATQEQRLMCVASGCPRRWSIGPARLCSAHAWADASLWPAITQQLHDIDTQRALANSQAEAPSQPARTLTKAEKVQVLRRITDSLTRMPS